MLQTAERPGIRALREKGVPTTPFDVVQTNHDIADDYAHRPGATCADQYEPVSLARDDDWRPVRLCSWCFNEPTRSAWTLAVHGGAWRARLEAQAYILTVRTRGADQDLLRRTLHANYDNARMAAGLVSAFSRSPVAAQLRSTHTGTQRTLPDVADALDTAAAHPRVAHRDDLAAVAAHLRTDVGSLEDMYDRITGEQWGRLALSEYTDASQGTGWLLLDSRNRILDSGEAPRDHYGDMLWLLQSPVVATVDPYTVLEVDPRDLRAAGTYLEHRYVKVEDHWTPVDAAAALQLYAHRTHDRVTFATLVDAAAAARS